MNDVSKSKKEIINDCAAKLFRKKGYAATSMQDIAEAVGMKAASLYNHIKSKQEILEFLLTRIATSFTSGLNEINSSSLNPRQKLEALVSLHVEMTFKFSDSIALNTGEWVHLEEPALSKYTKQRSSYEKTFKNILDACKEERLIDKNIDTDIALFSILSSLHWLYSWRNRNSKVSRIELEHQLKKILLEGLIV